MRLSRTRLALGGALVALAAGCLGPVASLYPPAPQGPAESVWIVDHGWHTGLVIERGAIPAGLLPEQDDFPGSGYLEVGWGDADFYRAPEPGLGAALRAAVASRASVVHVLGLPVRPEEAFVGSEVVRIRLSRPGFEALVRFVHDSFDRQGRQVAPALGGGPYGAGAFYPSRDRYNLLNTCNTWVARALRAAGAPITPAYALTAGNLMWQVRGLPQVAPRHREHASFLLLTSRLAARAPAQGGRGLQMIAVSTQADVSVGADEQSAPRPQRERAHRVRRRPSPVRRAPRPRW